MAVAQQFPNGNPTTRKERLMFTTTELAEYLDEIRRQVCSRCVERPPAGPPCAPLGKICGIEMHLPQIIDSIHQVKSGSIEPYLQTNRKRVCEGCAFQHSSICPCPMDYLAVLLVQAVETVDHRRAQEKAGVRSIEAIADLDGRLLWKKLGTPTPAGCG
jgi:hypothetical protein